MKGMIKLLAAAALVIGLAGCTTVDIPVSATSNPVGSRVGEATGTWYLGIFGDAQTGIREAAANGGITEISTVDFEVQNILGYLIVNYTTTVTGE